MRAVASARRGARVPTGRELLGNPAGISILYCSLRGRSFSSDITAHHYPHCHPDRSGRFFPPLANASAGRAVEGSASPSVPLLGGQSFSSDTKVFFSARLQPLRNWSCRCHAGPVARHLCLSHPGRFCGTDRSGGIVTGLRHERGRWKQGALTAAPTSRRSCLARLSRVSRRNPAISQGTALVANSLCHVQERRTMRESDVQIGNSGLYV
jgi:hypothetical protein